MASSTRSRVPSSTLVSPFATRETVWEETPACAATSAIDGARLARPGALRVVSVMVSLSSHPSLHVDVNMLWYRSDVDVNIHRDPSPARLHRTTVPPESQQGSCP
ncbi:hypothetical protein PLANTIT3_90152 [Plantibacter sp. T3]|nr:hypothetical protein PLANTIT3_90152 [Plantibacter sp. T3]